MVVGSDVSFELTLQDDYVEPATGRAAKTYGIVLWSERTPVTRERANALVQEVAAAAASVSGGEKEGGVGTEEANGFFWRRFRERVASVDLLPSPLATLSASAALAMAVGVAAAVSWRVVAKRRACS